MPNKALTLSGRFLREIQGRKGLVEARIRQLEEMLERERAYLKLLEEKPNAKRPHTPEVAHSQ